MSKKENGSQPAVVPHDDDNNSGASNSVVGAAHRRADAVSPTEKEENNKFSLEQLKELAREKEELANTYYEQLIRLKAEFENYRKRVERDRETHRSWAKEEVLVKQISLLDVMEQAISAARNTKDISSVVKGLEMIIKEFERMLAEEGVSVIETEGIFDPSRHEAVEIVEDSGSPDGTIAGVVARGYAINGRVIRPAKVKIVKNNKEDKVSQQEVEDLNPEDNSRTPEGD